MSAAEVAAKERRDSVLYNVREFVKCQNLLTSAWDKVVKQVELDVERCKLLNIPSIDPDQFDLANDISQYCQQSTSGEVAKDLKDLYWSAAIGKPIFDNLLRNLVYSAGMNVRSDLVIPALKSQRRASEKATSDYENASRVYDVVRGSVICKNIPEFLSFVNSLMTVEKESNLYTQSTNEVNSSVVTDSFDISFVRLKNRFASPTPYGYRDFIINIRIKISEGVYHICELQLHLRSLYEIYSRRHMHNIYSYFSRDYFRRGVNRPDEEEIESKHNLLKRLATFTSSAEVELLTDDIVKSQDISLINSFKGLLLNMGHFNEAEMCQRIIIESYQASSSIDADSRAIVDSLFQLVNILDQKNSLFEAEDICRRVLVGYERLLSRQSPVTVEAMSQLGKILLKQKNKMEEATKLLEQVATFKEKSLGPTNPITLVSLEFLSEAQVTLEDFAGAEVSLRKLLSAREKLLGTQNSSTIDAMINLAVILQRNKHLEESKELFERILAIKKKANEANDIVTIKIVDSLASINEELELFEQAEKLYSSNYQLRVRLFGENHIATVINLLNLAELYCGQSTFGKAAECYQQAKEVLEANFGIDNVKAKQAAKKAKKCLAEANRCLTISTYNDARSHIMINVFGPGSGRKFTKCRRCENCSFEYTMLKREHHCRLCIRSVCGTCSPATAFIPFTAHLDNNNGNQAGSNIKSRVRVCNPCLQAINLYNASKSAKPMRISSTSKDLYCDDIENRRTESVASLRSSYVGTDMESWKEFL